MNNVAREQGVTVRATTKTKHKPGLLATKKGARG